MRDGEGPPLLAGALGWIVCRRVAELEAGDHTLFVGEVVSVELGREARRARLPRRSYRTL